MSLTTKQVYLFGPKGKIHLENAKMYTARFT